MNSPTAIDPSVHDRGGREDLWIWIAAIAVLIYATRDLWHGGYPAGWDVLPHYYLTEKMVALLSQGRITGYDPLWYGGYPLFSLYPPLFYLLAALPVWLSHGAVTTAATLLCINLLLPIAYLATLSFSARACFGPSAGRFAILLGLLTLLLPPSFAHTGIGLAAQIQIGFLPNLLALPIFIALLGILGAPRPHGAIRHLPIAAFLLALLIICHQLTALFALFSLCVYGFGRKARGAMESLLVIGLGLLLSCWWWLPSLALLPYGSGQAIGLQGEFSDPLFVLLPELSLINIRNIFIQAWRDSLWLANSGRWFAALYAGVEMLQLFPWVGVALLIGVVVGLRHQIQSGRWFLPLLFLVTLVFLPRNLLPALFTTPVHYYRFLQPLMCIEVLLAAAGFSVIFTPLAADAGAWKRRGIALFAVILVALPIATAPSRFDLRTAAPIGFSNNKEQFHAALDDYARYAPARRMLNFIAAQKPIGLVLDENAESNWQRLGTPHFFATMLPLKFGIATANGLLVESAPLATYYNSAAFRGSEHLRWGRQALWGRSEFSNQPVQSMLRKLKALDVEYIVTSSRKYRQRLQRSGGASLVRRIGPFALFRVGSQLREPKLTTAPAPHLYIDNGFPFRDFAEILFLETRNGLPLVVSTDKSLDDIPPEERQRFGGLIVGLAQGSIVTATEIARWQQSGKKLTIINGYPTRDVKSSREFAIIPRFDGLADVAALRESLVEDNSTINLLRVERPTISPLGSLSISSVEATIAPMAYSPCWQMASSAQTLYRAAPGFIFFFGKGKNDLSYSCTRLIDSIFPSVSSNKFFGVED